MRLITTLLVAAALAAGQAPAPVTVSSEELHAAFNNLKAATEEPKDDETIKQLAAETSKAARAIIKAPKPAGEDPAVHKSQVDFARQVEEYADYAIYAAALRATTPAKRIELFEALEQQSPSGSYTAKLYSAYAAAMAQTGQEKKLFAFAEKAIARDGSNEDLLLILADGAMTRKQYERAANYGARLASVMSAHSAPQGTSAADWEKRKGAIIGRGYWIAGISFATLNRYPQADKNLRAALPYIKGEEEMNAAALFFLGVANYNLARATQSRAQLKEAIAFSEQAATLKSTYADSAQKNAYAMKQEMSRYR